MFLKLALLILCLGVCGGGVLSARHARLQAAHEIASSRLRLKEHDRRIDELRARIAAEARPDAIARRLEQLTPTTPTVRSRVGLPSESVIPDETWLAPIERHDERPLRLDPRP